MAYQFPTNPTNGDIVEVDQEDGGVVYYQYNAAENKWDVIDTATEGNRVVFTKDVLTVSDPPTLPSFVINEPDDLLKINDQQQVNWLLAQLALEKEDPRPPILQPGEPNEIIKSIKILINNESLLNKISKNNIKTISNYYRQSSYGVSLNKFYDKLNEQSF